MRWLGRAGQLKRDEERRCRRHGEFGTPRERIAGDCPFFVQIADAPLASRAPVHHRRR